MDVAAGRRARPCPSSPSAVPVECATVRWPGGGVRSRRSRRARAYPSFGSLEGRAMAQWAGRRLATIFAHSTALMTFLTECDESDAEL